jgi:chromosome segregation ATPase
MRLRRIAPFLLAATALVALNGCGYVRFGKPPATTPAGPLGDEQLLKENASLRTEKKILQQELALTRAQGDALRMAVENRTADGDTSKRLVEKLNQTTRDLATLRADYAKLQADRASAPAELADLKSKLGSTEDQLAASLKNYTQLQEEIGRIRTDLDQTRAENTALTAQVKVVTAKNEEAQVALAQLNSDLLAQKNLRAAAEQDAATLRTQLSTANTQLSDLARQRTAPAAPAKAIGATESPELRTQLDALRKQVWSLETERNELQQKLAAAEAAAKTPNLADVRARAEAEGKLAAALENAKMLRDENDHLKASTNELARTKTDLESELAKARATLPLAAQAQTLRDQLALAQAQATSLADENTKLKARLALVGGGNSRPSGPIAVLSDPAPAPALNPANASPAPVPAAPATPPPAKPAGGVTATFVTNVAGSNPANPAVSSANGAKPGASGAPLRFHTVSAGDTLSKISNLYYGTPARWAEILVANRDILGEDNNLVIGRTLRIP